MNHPTAAETPYNSYKDTFKTQHLIDDQVMENMSDQQVVDIIFNREATLNQLSYMVQPSQKVQRMIKAKHKELVKIIKLFDKRK